MSIGILASYKVSSLFPFITQHHIFHLSPIYFHILYGNHQYDILAEVCSCNTWEEVSMEVEELKSRLRSLLHQRDMLSYERDSLELFDLIAEIDEEIRELHQKLKVTA